MFDFFLFYTTVQTAWLIHVGVAPKLISYFLIAHTNEWSLSIFVEVYKVNSIRFPVPL